MVEVTGVVHFFEIPLRRVEGVEEGAVGVSVAFAVADVDARYLECLKAKEAFNGLFLQPVGNLRLHEQHLDLSATDDLNSERRKRLFVDVNAGRDLEMVVKPCQRHLLRMFGEEGVDEMIERDGVALFFVNACFLFKVLKEGGDVAGDGIADGGDDVNGFALLSENLGCGDDFRPFV